MNEPNGCDAGADAGRRRWLKVAMLQCLVSACGGGGGDAPGPTSAASPATTSAPPPAPTPAPPNPPAATGSARIFVFSRLLSYPVSETTNPSRFVLYDDGAFALQFVGGEYRGRYAEANGTIDFSWEGWSAAGPWGATGTLSGDELAVRYNLVMQMTDFEDAVYTLTR